ncbi:hypothetical protein LCGC14_1463460 [marine sediment metagenome]|uniref:Uncharacterized protein n=1 Tax=marine sediment metagenome TaxID=412755 RepID=A0A0F9MG85_9ZZZZ
MKCEYCLNKMTTLKTVAHLPENKGRTFVTHTCYKCGIVKSNYTENENETEYPVIKKRIYTKLVSTDSIELNSNEEVIDTQYNQKTGLVILIIQETYLTKHKPGKLKTDVQFHPI